jgi:hypothetical protein
MTRVAPRLRIVARVTFAILASIAGLPAQKIALAGDTERVVVVLDVHDLLPAHRGDPAVLVKAPADRTAAIRPTELERLAGFMRTFVVPESESGADLRPLGDRHVVVLGTPVQTAAAERWLARVKASLDKHYQIDLRLCEVPAGVFDRVIAPRLRQPTAAAPDRSTRATVLDDDAERALTESLREAGVTKFTQFPQPIAPSLTMARLMVGEHLSYVKDFTLEVAAAAFVAAPVTEVVFDGHDVDVFCAKTGDGTIGLQLQLLDQTVE